ncbi:VOC family protein [Primorskyibacter sp. S87]|uniref:VOC family protein n=1 Tax=Primorskyibacter sp. S87 TaxID=3415126 RepID=UPI003C7BCD42
MPNRIGSFQTSRWLVLTGLCLLLTACTPTMRQTNDPGSFAWFDLVTETPDVARGFYSDLFGWRFSKPLGEDTELISSNGAFIGGLVSVIGGEQRAESKWEPVLSVSDTLAAIHTTESLGGKLSQRLDTEGRGVFAAISDNSGATLTLYDGSAGVPRSDGLTLNSWVWVDLLTDNTSRARHFYRELVGFETRKSGKFTIFTKAGRTRAGLVRVPRSQVEPNWLPYVLVADLEATIASARSLGGGLLTREGEAAILLDPTGAAIGIVTRKGLAQ